MVGLLLYLTPDGKETDRMNCFQPKRTEVGTTAQAHQAIEGIPDAETAVAVLADEQSLIAGRFEGGEILSINPNDLHTAVGSDDVELEVTTPAGKLNIAARIASSATPNEVAKESGQINMVVSPAKTWSAFQGVVLPMLLGLFTLGRKAYNKAVRPMIECIMPNLGKKTNDKSVFTSLTTPLYIWVSVGKDAFQKFWVRLNVPGSYRKLNADGTTTQIATPAALLPGNTGLIYFRKNEQGNFILRLTAEDIRKHFGLIRAALRDGLVKLTGNQVEIRMNVAEIAIPVAELGNNVYVLGFSRVHMDAQRGAYVVATFEQNAKTYTTRIYVADVEAGTVAFKAVQDGKGVYTSQIGGTGTKNRLSLFLGTTATDGVDGSTTQRIRISTETPAALQGLAN